MKHFRDRFEQVIAVAVALIVFWLLWMLILAILET